MYKELQFNLKSDSNFYGDVTNWQQPLRTLQRGNLKAGNNIIIIIIIIRNSNPGRVGLFFE